MSSFLPIVIGAKLNLGLIYCAAFVYATTVLYKLLNNNDKLKELKQDLEDFHYFLENYGPEIEKEFNAKQKERLVIEKQIAKKDAMLNKACELLEMGVYSLDKFVERTNFVTADKEALERQLQAINDKPMKNVERARMAIPILSRCLDKYWSLDAREKNDMLKAIIEKVEYSKMQRNNRWDKSVNNLKLKILLQF